MSTTWQFSPGASPFTFPISLSLLYSWTGCGGQAVILLPFCLCGCVLALFCSHAIPVRPFCLPMVLLSCPCTTCLILPTRLPWFHFRVPPSASTPTISSGFGIPCVTHTAMPFSLPTFHAILHTYLPSLLFCAYTALPGQHSLLGMSTVGTIALLLTTRSHSFRLASGGWLLGGMLSLLINAPICRSATLLPHCLYRAPALHLVPASLPFHCRTLPCTLPPIPPAAAHLDCVPIAAPSPSVAHLPGLCSSSLSVTSSAATRSPPYAHRGWACGCLCRRAAPHLFFQFSACWLASYRYPAFYFITIPSHGHIPPTTRHTRGARATDTRGDCSAVLLPALPIARYNIFFPPALRLAGIGYLWVATTAHPHFYACNTPCSDIYTTRAAATRRASLAPVSLPAVGLPVLHAARILFYLGLNRAVARRAGGGLNSHSAAS